MKLLSSLFVSALFAASANLAVASTINLDSYGTGSTVAGASNSALVYLGSQGITYDAQGNPLISGSFVGASSSTTYNLTSGLSPWSAAQGSSFWVAQNSGDSPGGGHVENNNEAYLFATTFTDMNPKGSSGYIDVMADDTTAVFFNGVEIAAPASNATAGTCDSSKPNCTSIDQIFLPTADFSTTGTNTLVFAVLQEHGSAEGLDFVGQVNVTPEPDSLLLLGTGLSMLAGLAYSRRVQA